MKRVCKSLLFIISISIYAENQGWRKDCGPILGLIDRDNRSKYLSACPSNVGEMLSFLVAYKIRANQSAFGYDLINNGQEGLQQDLSNQDADLNIGSNSEVGSFILNLMPEPIKVVVSAAFLMRKVKEAAWFKRLFKIYPAMSDDECRDVINQNPYTAELFDRIHKISSYIYWLDGGSSLERTVARIQILEAELPPPLDKKFKKAKKKLARACANGYGDLMDSMGFVNAKNIFSSYLNQNLNDPQVFIKKIPKLKSYRNFRPKKGMSSAFNQKVIRFIQGEPNMSVIDLLAFVKMNGGLIIDELYKHFVRKRVHAKRHEILNDFKRGGLEVEQLPVEMQVELLLRSHYQVDLEKWVLDGVGDDVTKELTYRSLVNYGATGQTTKGYSFTVLKNFIENSCKGMGNTDRKLKESLFHASGVLKKYADNLFVRAHLADRYLDSEILHRAVNYALAIRDKNNSHQIKEITQEILNNSVRSLECLDSDLSKMYEEEVLFLYQHLVENGESGLASQIINKAGNLSLEGTGFKDKLWFDAYEKARSERFHVYQKAHNIESKLCRYIQENHMNLYLFSEFEGNSLQHYIAKELLKIVKKSMNFSGGFVYELTQFAEIGQSFNRVGKIVESLEYVDLCNDILRYLEAMALRSRDTVENTYFMGVHPFLYVLNIASDLKQIIKGNRVCAQGLFYNHENSWGSEGFISGLAKKLAQEFYDSFEQEQVDAHFITDRWAAKKSCALLGEFCSKIAGAAQSYRSMTAAEAVNLIPQNNEAAFAGCGEALRVEFEKGGRGDFEVVGPQLDCSKKLGKLVRRGRVLKTVSKPQSWAEYLYSYLSNPKTNSIVLGRGLNFKHASKYPSIEDLLWVSQKYGNIFELSEKRLHSINQLMETDYIKMRMAFGKMQKVKIRIKNIVQAKIKITGKKLDTFALNGIHSDYGGKIRKFGESGGDIKIIQTAHKLGCYKATVRGIDGKSIVKTFFPENWNENKIIEKVCEALEQAKLKKNVRSLDKIHVGFGYTSEGIKIKFFVAEKEEGLEVVLAYPCGEWIAKTTK